MRATSTPRGLACRDDSDDVLYAIEDGTARVATVHLTWDRPPVRPPWPTPDTVVLGGPSSRSTLGDFSRRETLPLVRHSEVSRNKAKTTSRPGRRRMSTAICRLA